MYGSKVGITSANAKNQKIYGVNGTFYHTMGHKIPDYRLKVYGVAIANGKIADIKQANQDGGVFGGDNNHTDLDSFMLGTYNMIEGSDVFIAKQRTFPFNAETKNVYVSDCRWAIGGHTLNLTSNFTSETQFNNNLSASARNYNSDTQRTFMGQKSNMVYLCTVHSACKMYDEYLILKKLGCTIGMNLDGGGSTMITHPKGHTHINDPGRLLTTIMQVYNLQE